MNIGEDPSLLGQTVPEFEILLRVLKFYKVT